MCVRKEREGLAGWLLLLNELTVAGGHTHTYTRTHTHTHIHTRTVSTTSFSPLPLPPPLSSPLPPNSFLSFTAQAIFYVPFVVCSLPLLSLSLSPHLPTSWKQAPGCNKFMVTVILPYTSTPVTVIHNFTLWGSEPLAGKLDNQHNQEAF